MVRIKVENGIYEASTTAHSKPARGVPDKTLMRQGAQKRALFVLFIQEFVCHVNFPCAQVTDTIIYGTLCNTAIASTNLGFHFLPPNPCR